jgi:hypothetical protein
VAKQLALALIVVAAAVAGAYLYVAEAAYHPVVRMASPDGLIYTAVQKPTAKTQDCDAANNRFIAPMRQCRECRIELVTCRRRLEAFERDVYEGKAAGRHQVLAAGLRIAIEGPPRVAKASCEMIVAEMRQRGVASAACVAPR